MADKVGSPLRSLDLSKISRISRNSPRNNSSNGFRGPRVRVEFDRDLALREEYDKMHVDFASAPFRPVVTSHGASTSVPSVIAILTVCLDRCALIFEGSTDESIRLGETMTTCGLSLR